ncbi:hypothetical protein [Acinetobacter venetianus]|uniref:hypothetical protein n=1 Tax=Acinetobacter venetianus TaxID=52133 RepID=UPI00289D3B47|nr:hypothetical protein [Acinetobacter venetianus]
MKKHLIIALPTVLLFSGCNEVNFTKLNYQAQLCTADNSISCNDVRIKKAIVATKMAREQLEENKDKVVREAGENGYQQLLMLMDKKIAFLKDQRPNLYLRWFERDTPYYKEVDLGESIDMEIENIINGNHKNPEPVQQPIVQAPPPVQQEVVEQEQPDTMKDIVSRQAPRAFQQELNKVAGGSTYQYDSIKFRGEPWQENNTFSYPVTLRFRINGTDVYYNCESTEIGYDQSNGTVEAYIPDACFIPN